MTELCVEKDDRIKVLEALLEEHKRQIEDYAVDLRIAYKQVELFRSRATERRKGEEEDTKRLHEQRLWEAYTSLRGLDFPLRMTQAKEEVSFFEDRHGQEGDKP